MASGSPSPSPSPAPSPTPAPRSFLFTGHAGRAVRIVADVCAASAVVPDGARLHLRADRLTNVAAAARLVVHWALGRDADPAWHPCPHGWVTDPAEAWDAGMNAWQSPFAVDADPHVRTFDLHLPTEALHRFDSLLFTLKVDQHWLHSDRPAAVPLRRLERSGDRSAPSPPVNGTDHPVPPDAADKGDAGQSHSEPTHPPQRIQWEDNDLTVKHGGLGVSSGWCGEVSFETIGELAAKESSAERSLMHRYGIAADVLQRDLDREQHLVAVYLWLLYAWERKLVWNRNYNVKPKEIAAAASAVWLLVCGRLQQPAAPLEALRLILRVCLKGAGGRDSGQEIRDQILTIQSRNNCKGGMLEEFHQKIHNNSSPDDIVICEALIHFIDAGQDLAVYWSHLAQNGITRQRLESYDRAIRSAPSFREDCLAGLRRDLVAYLIVLNRVHSSEDLTSAAQLIFGFTRESHKSSRVADVTPIAQFEGDDDLKTLFYVAASPENSFEEALLSVVEARRILLSKLEAIPVDRAPDLIAADLALDSRARTLIESNISALGKSDDSNNLLAVLKLALENACLSSGNNAELVLSLKQLRLVKPETTLDWALRSFAALERARNYLSSVADSYQKCITPTASFMASQFDLDFTEDISETVLRSSGLTALSLLLTTAARRLRSVASLGDWEIVAPLPSANTVGVLRLVPNFEDLEGYSMGEKVIVFCDQLHGDEDIPLGVAVIVTQSSVDVLSHLAVRARNDGVALVTCHDSSKYRSLTQIAPAQVEVTCLRGEVQIEKTSR